MGNTRTTVILELSKAAYAEIEAKLIEAGYDHTIINGLIDMHGLAIRKEKQ